MQAQNQKRSPNRAGILDFIGKHGLVFLTVCVVLPFCLSSPLGFVLFYIGGIPLTVWAMIRWHRQRSANKARLQAAQVNMIPGILREFFEDVEYRPNDTIGLSQVFETSIFSAKDAEKIKGSDYIHASFRGTPFSLCNATVYCLDQVPIPDEPVPRYRDVTHITFQGQYLILETDLHPRTPITVMAKANSSYRLANQVKTRNSLFDQEFEVSGDPLEISALLNSYRLQQITAANQAAGCNMTLRFLPNGHVGIALKNKKPILAVSGHPIQGDGDLYKQFRAEIGWICRILELLSLK